MKYLRIHKVIWLLLVIAYTFLEFVYLSIFYICYFVWTFKVDKNFWAMFHESSYFRMGKNGEFYEVTEHLDKTPFETISRRYNWCK